MRCLTFLPLLLLAFSYALQASFLLTLTEREKDQVKVEVYAGKKRLIGSTTFNEWSELTQAKEKLCAGSLTTGSAGMCTCQCVKV